MSALYLFVILLLVTTVISSFGGALRVEENFYNEVFDLTDENEPLVKSELEESSDVPQEKNTEIKSDQEKTVAKEEPEGNDEDAITLAPFHPENATEEKKDDIVEEELIEEEVEPYEMDDQYAAF